MLHIFLTNSTVSFRKPLVASREPARDRFHLTIDKIYALGVVLKRYQFSDTSIALDSSRFYVAS